MGAVLAILSRLGALKGKVSVWTTRWVLQDPQSNISKLISYFDGVELMASGVDFSDAPYDGLRAFERGFVKEGVGAGGTMLLAESMGVDKNEIKSAIYSEYERLRKLGKA